MSVEWSSIDPRTSHKVVYGPNEAGLLEAAYSRGDPTCDLMLPFGTFRVDLKSMIQYNAVGGGRRVMREVVMAAPAAVMDGVEDSGAIAERCRLVIAICDNWDAKIQAAEGGAGAAAMAAPAALGGPETRVLVDYATDAILRAFAHQRFQRRYGCCSSDLPLLSLPPDAQVPAYFANVQGGTIYQRKALSMLGLRNLLLRGPEIYAEMRGTLFSGFMGDYRGMAGPHKMKHYTGNVVDLDTVLVRCTDRSLLNGAFGKKFRSQSELSGSPEVEEYVWREARERIDAFRKLFGLEHDDDAARRRRIYLPPLPPDAAADAAGGDAAAAGGGAGGRRRGGDIPGKRRACPLLPCPPSRRRRRTNDSDGGGREEIPLAQGHMDRGHVPVWHYVNVGQDTYHVNVPELPDVFGALLRAPFHMVRAHAKGTLMALNADSAGGHAAREQRQDAFYEDCVADSCFNLKWKAIEAYSAGLEAEEGLFDVLSRLMRDYQGRFTAELSEEEEEALLLRIADETRAVGRDGGGAVRRVTAEDVRKWARINATGVMEAF